MNSASVGACLFRQLDVELGWLQQLTLDSLRECGESTGTAGVAIRPLNQTLVAVSVECQVDDSRFSAAWHRQQKTWPTRLSSQLTNPIHLVAYERDEFELVRTYARGKAVGGERVEYDACDVPDTDEGFAAMKAEWPFSRLAKIVGCTRKDLERMHRKVPLFVPCEGPLSNLSIWMALQSDHRRSA